MWIIPQHYIHCIREIYDILKHGSDFEKKAFYRPLIYNTIDNFEWTVMKQTKDSISSSLKMTGWYEYCLVLVNAGK